MRKILNPRWLFLVNTLPMLFLCFMLYYSFTGIRTELDDNSLQQWFILAVGLGVLGIGNTLYALLQSLRGREVSLWYGIIAVATTAIVMFWYFIKQYILIPNSIPNWMVPNMMGTFFSTCLMPTLFYALLVMVLQLTPEEKSFKVWKSIVMTFVFPIGFYILGYLIMLFFQFCLYQNILVSDWTYSQIVNIANIGIVIGTICCNFFLLRSIYLLIRKKDVPSKNTRFILTLIVALVFPIGGLLVNNLLLGYPQDGIAFFGNFNSFWFYLLAAVNGVLLCLPDVKSVKARLWLFIGRSICYTFTLYFFVVLLPYTPLSLIAIILWGLGLLMLTPTMLFLVHTQTLVNDFRFLSAHYYKGMLWAVCIASAMTIPSFITASFLQYKWNLEETMDYVYKADYEAKTPYIDSESVNYTLDMIQKNKDTERSFLTHTTPYITSFFNHIVLDNLTLSDSKINVLKDIFSNDTINVNVRQNNNQRQSASQNNNPIKLTKLTAKSNYNSEAGCWSSWVELEIKDQRKNHVWQSEYKTSFMLPEGAFIADYYLYIGDRKEIGILAEKRSALWVYNNIVRSQQDPGLLYYNRGNCVELSVFPFNRGETRRTGIEVIHAEPCVLEIDGKRVKLGNNSEPQQELGAIQTDAGFYVSASVKSTLPRQQREGYLHFIIDRHYTDVEGVQAAMQLAMDSMPQWCNNYKVSLVDWKVTTLAQPQEWKKELTKHTPQGGFFADRALKQMWYESYMNPSGTFPVPVIITNKSKLPTIEDNYRDWQFTFPDNHWLYVIRAEGGVTAHNLLSMTTTATDCVIHPTQEVSAYHTLTGDCYYLSSTNSASLIPARTMNLEIEESENRTYIAAIENQNIWQGITLRPHLNDELWLPLVQSSFSIGVMNPTTAYIALETEAQKIALLRKQKEALRKDSSLDLGQEPVRMSEPALWVMTALLLLFIGLREYRSRRKESV